MLFKVDAAKQTLFGYSPDFLPSVCFFWNPKDFSTYILSSPAIWYDDKEVLADEEAFSKRGRAGKLRPNWERPTMNWPAGHRRMKSKRLAGGEDWIRTRGCVPTTHFAVVLGMEVAHYDG
jgi:hypothetical protein